jgi:hypothetical protein
MAPSSLINEGNMDADSHVAVKLLEGLASINSKLLELTEITRNHSKVARVLHSLECREYRTGSVLEGYVDAELENGKSLAWWLEVHWSGDTWAIETKVLLSDSSGQDVIRDLPIRRSEGFDDFMAQLSQSAFDLLSLSNILEDTTV